MSEIKIVFSDFDGTLTDANELGPVFFDVVELLRSKDIPLVIVTGRSVSWGHFILSHFSYIKQVIVEGGGMLLTRDPHGVIEERLLIHQKKVNKLQEFVDYLQNKFPSLPLSVDSFGRRTDRAIELYDLELDEKRKKKVEHCLRDHKINFSKSNVHLNFWCGELSKYKGVQTVLKQQGASADDAVYFGDSLNDQSMFKDFKNSVGVSNIQDVVDKLNFKPTTILEGHENRGPYGVLNHLKSIL